MVETKVQEEVLYREGLAMGLDKDDTIVKRRMAQKMQFIAEDVAAAREPTSAELKSLVREECRQVPGPPRVSFRHLYFSPDKRGHAREGRCGRCPCQARGSAGRRQARGDAGRSVHVPGVLPRSRARIILGKEFGPQFALAVVKLPPGSWQGPIESGFGWHLVFVDTLVPGRVPAFRGDRRRREDGVALRAEGNGVGEGVQGHAREVHSADTRAARRADGRAHHRCAAPEGNPDLLGRRPAMTTLAVRCLRALLLAAMGLMPFASFAHEARPAYLEIKETAPGQFSVLWRTPVLAGMRLPLVLQMPEGVRNVKPPVVDELADSLVERRWIDAGPNGLAGKRIEITGLQLTITDALVRVELLDGRTIQAIARPSQPWVEIAAAQSRWEVMGSVHRRGHPAHPVRRRSSAVRAGPAAHRGQRMDAGEDGHRLHRCAQHHARRCHARICRGAGAAAQCRDRLEHPFSRTGDRPRVARRDELHDPSPVGGGIRVRAAARIRLRHRADQRRAAAAGAAAGTPFLQRRRRTGAARFRRLVLAMGRSFRVLEVRWPRWVQALPGYTVGTLGAFWTIQRVALLIGALR